MKKFLLNIFLIIFSVNSLKAGITTVNLDTEINLSKEKINSQTQNKKIVVLTSKGGNAHMEACQALKNTLPNYELKIINPIHEYFKSITDGEDFYVSMIQNGWIRTWNFLIKYPVPIFFKSIGASIKKTILKILEQEKPDMLISVIPILNLYASQAAQIYKIPFLVITLDADLTLWLLEMEKNQNKNFILTVETMTENIKKQLDKKNISDNAIREVGFHIRKDFETPKDLNAIRKEWNIPDNKKIIMLIRGGTGSIKLYKYVKELVKLKENIHLLVCIGKNIKLKNMLDKIKNKGSVTFSVIPFTNKIPDLMAISDLLITQPSPTVCNEAIFMKLPILIDLSGAYLFWEEKVVDWIKLRGYGKIFNHMNQLNKLVTKNLNKKEFIMNKTQPTMPDFKTEINKIVDQMLNKNYVVTSINRKIGQFKRTLI
ncbi:hypothetical protein K9L05_03580 [Candidatus Babeliales bacterium]|nr:hypothetical protein [Candidatus Babeliales bacterium]MCF7899698.1 hypothetical protein [Candidatus Babeliales bacterium]